MKTLKSMYECLLVVMILVVCGCEEPQSAGTATVLHQVTSNWDMIPLKQQPQAALQQHTVSITPSTTHNPVMAIKPAFSFLM